MKRLLFTCGVMMVLGGCKTGSEQGSEWEYSSSSSRQNGGTSSAGAVSSSCQLYSAADAESDRAELLENKALWDSLGLDSYQYTYTLRSDRFPPISFEPAVVSEGVVTEVYETESGEYIDAADYALYDIRTVDQWFDEVARLIDSAVGNQLSLSFDAEYGYPNKVNVDFAPCGGFDGKSTYTLSDLQ